MRTKDNRNMSLSFAVCLTLFASQTSGCATLISGGTQAVTVQAIDAESFEPIAGASCKVRDGAGGLYGGPGNPVVLSIPKGNAPLTPACRAAGYTQISFAVGDSLDKVAALNVIFWPGFVVDAVAGNLQKYPGSIFVAMEQNTSPGTQATE